MVDCLCSVAPLAFALYGLAKCHCYCIAYADGAEYFFYHFGRYDVRYYCCSYVRADYYCLFGYVGILVFLSVIVEVCEYAVEHADCIFTARYALYECVYGFIGIVYKVTYGYARDKIEQLESFLALRPEADERYDIRYGVFYYYCLCCRKCFCGEVRNLYVFINIVYDFNCLAELAAETEADCVKCSIRAVINAAYGHVLIKFRCVSNGGICYYFLDKCCNGNNVVIILIAGEYFYYGSNLVNDIVYHKGKSIVLKLFNGGIAIEIFNCRNYCLCACRLLVAIENFNNVCSSLCYNDAHYSFRCCFLAVTDGNVCKDLLYHLNDVAYPAISVKILFGNAFNDSDYSLGHINEGACAVKLEGFRYVSVGNNLFKESCAAVGYLFIYFGNVLYCKLYCIDCVMPCDLLGCFNEFAYRRIAVKHLYYFHNGVAVNTRFYEAFYNCECAFSYGVNLFCAGKLNGRECIVGKEYVCKLNNCVKYGDNLILRLALGHNDIRYVLCAGEYGYNVKRVELMLFNSGVINKDRIGKRCENVVYELCLLGYANLKNCLKAGNNLFRDLLLLEFVPDVCGYELGLCGYENCAADHIGYIVGCLNVNTVFKKLGNEDAEHIVCKSENAVYGYLVELVLSNGGVIFKYEVCYAKESIHNERRLIHKLCNYVVKICYNLFLDLTSKELILYGNGSELVICGEKHCFADKACNVRANCIVNSVV